VLPDALGVAGGDGTLHNFLNRVKGSDLPLYYFPTGTLNEKARVGERCPLVGQINEDYFIYVVAAGSFTPIGYTAEVGVKRKVKVLAYLWQSLKEYRVHRIPATISVDGTQYVGTYTLIMVLHSPRCFLFRFNKMYSPESESVHVLLISAPPKDNLWGRVRIFAPLFRAFFIGFRHEREGRRLVFRQGKTAVVKLPRETVCNIDGERRCLSGTYRLTATHPRPAVTVCRLLQK
jgi:diacylglycerol kinase family enzyme